MTINLSILDFKSKETVFKSYILLTINLSILDFKSHTNHINRIFTITINLSILDFKYLSKAVTTSERRNYKSIHTGF